MPARLRLIGLGDLEIQYIPAFAGAGAANAYGSSRCLVRWLAKNSRILSFWCGPLAASRCFTHQERVQSRGWVARRRSNGTRRGAGMHEIPPRRVSTRWLTLWAWLLSCVLIVAGELSADDREEAEEWASQPGEVEDASQPVVLAGPISSGFLLVDGQFVSAPYTVELIESKVRVNGHLTSMPQLGWDGPPPVGAGGMRWRGAGINPARKVRWRRASPQHYQFARRLERDLSNDALIIIFEGEYPFFFSSSTAASIFAALSEPESASAKVSRILADPACSQVSSDAGVRLLPPSSPMPILIAAQGT